ncbi:MAG TPA: glycosyltransferase [Burkholderiales bacterium]|jgi:glycosyltransferase involved in cell wall biosynthesis|nr:glycosyltransferase [Burkholderiales bacterium]
MSDRQPKVAVVHEWLLDYAGSERVLREILAVVPDADLYALVDLPEDDLREAIPKRARATSFIQSLPRPRRWLRYYLPLMPLAVEQFDLSAYDIVISSSHAVAKGVITGPAQMHLSYVHSPMRYAWDLQHEYLRAARLERGPMGWLARLMLHRLRQWDARSANGVDVFLANSQHVARRIRKAYGRDAEVVYPPVDVSSFPLREAKDDFYVTVSRLEAYKRIDLLLAAFRQMPERQLVVVGDGPEMRRLRAAAPGNVSFPGRLPSAAVLEHMQRARAFLFAGIEDFGIVMAEAQACGTPLIAFAAGGAAEIVRGEESASPSGLLFHEQTAEALVQAVHRFERAPFRFLPAACHANALRFDRKEFRTRFAALLWRHWAQFPGKRAFSSTTQET